MGRLTSADSHVNDGRPPPDFVEGVVLASDWYAGVCVCGGVWPPVCTRLAAALYEVGLDSPGDGARPSIQQGGGGCRPQVGGADNVAAAAILASLGQMVLSSPPGKSAWGAPGCARARACVCVCVWRGGLLQDRPVVIIDPFVLLQDTAMAGRTGPDDVPIWDFIFRYDNGAFWTGLPL